MNIEDAQKIIAETFVSAVRKAFYQAIQFGFNRYNRIRKSEDYESLGEYAKNTKRRTLYSSVCSYLDSDIIRSVGFETSLEIFTSSYKTKIENTNVLIDVFDSQHDNSRHFQDSRFKQNGIEGQKYIILVYYGDKEKGILERIMIRVFDEQRTLVYEEDLL